MGVPSVVMMDYEFTEAFFFKRLTRSILMPAAIPDERLIACGFPMRKVKRYDGFKEELYLPSFKPDPQFRAGLNIPDDKILLTIRPSAMMANYHNPLSEQIVLTLLEKALADPEVLPLVVSRTKADRTLIVERFGSGPVFGQAGGRAAVDLGLGCLCQWRRHDESGSGAAGCACLFHFYGAKALSGRISVRAGAPGLCG